MKTNKVILVVLLALSMLVFVGCGGSDNDRGDSAQTDQKEPVVLKLGHIQTEKHVWHKGAQKFAELVEQKTDGQVKIEIYPNSTIGNDRDMAEGLQMGSVDFALIAGVLGNFEPSFQILELPFLIKDEDHLRKVIYGPIGQELFDRLLKNADIRGLAYWERGPRHLTTNFPVNSVEDVQGLKMRVPEIPAFVAVWKAIGANPTPMAWGEVYTSLQQGVIDAQENPVPYIYAANVYEVQSHIAMTAHKYEYVTLSMSNRTYEKLTPEQQKAIEEAAQEVTEYENNLVHQKTEELFKELQNLGMKVTYPDTTEFAERAKSVHKEFAEKIDAELYQKIVAAAQ
jgi:tripartite ATP-independent transporter DctP family solute receptor